MGDDDEDEDIEWDDDDEITPTKKSTRDDKPKEKSGQKKGWDGSEDSYSGSDD